MFQEASHIKNKIVLILCHIHLMYSEVAWVIASSGTQVQPQIMLDPGMGTGMFGNSSSDANNTRS